MGPFVVISFKVPNAVEVALTGPFARKHPVFPISLLKKYKETDENTFPNRKNNKPTPSLENEELVVESVLNQRRHGKGKNQKIEYLVRFKNKGSDFDKWLPATEIKNSGVLLRDHRLKQKQEKMT